MHEERHGVWWGFLPLDFSTASNISHKTYLTSSRSPAHCSPHSFSLVSKLLERDTRQEKEVLIFIGLENLTLKWDVISHVWSSEPQKNTGMLRRIFYWAKLSSWSQTNLSYELFCRVFMFIFRGKTAAETRRGRGEGDLSLEFVFCWRSGDCCQHQASLVRPALINTTIVSLPQ